MRATGRSAAVLLAALLSWSVTACGARSGTPEAAPASPVTSGAPAARCAGPDQQVRVPSYGPSGYVGDLPGDMPPNYAANHAFQRRLDLCGDDLVNATAAAERARRALRHLPETSAPAVRRAVEEALDPDGEALIVTASGEAVTFIARTSIPSPDIVGRIACLEGTVGPDGVRVEPHGQYSEGGCIKPVGGH